MPLRQFSFVGRSDAVSRLHQLALAVDPGCPGAVGRVGWIAAKLGWFVVCVRQVATYVRRFGRHVRATDGISYVQQVRGAWHCMWRHNQSARHYYWRKLYRIADREAWLPNFEHRETNTLLDHLNRNANAHRLTDKFQFDRHCRTHRLPTASLVAAWETGGQMITPASSDPAADVFIKPTTDFGGVGTMLIPFDAATRTYTYDGRQLGWTDLLDAIGAGPARDRAYLLQRRLRNSAAWSVFGLQDVCNLRIVTAIGTDGSIELIAAVMRVPSSFTTQGHDRNVLFSTVDVHDGRMGIGLFRDIRLPQFSRHPDTGHVIEGWPLPRWGEIVQLVTAAHATCPWLVFVGWDVVDSDAGLLLLEANSNWGGDSAQLPGAPGLGDTPFVRTYLAWEERQRIDTEAGSPAPGQHARLAFC